MGGGGSLAVPLGALSGCEGCLAGGEAWALSRVRGLISLRVGWGVVARGKAGCIWEVLRQR